MQQAVYQAELDEPVEKRSGIERRQREVTQWPTLNDAGDQVYSDRRLGERRASVL